MGSSVDHPQLAASVIALRLDANGRICDATDQASCMLGVAPDDLFGLRLRDIVVEDWRALADAATARITCGDDRPFQLMLSSRNGRRILVQMASRRVMRGARPQFLLAWSEHILQPEDAPVEFSVAELRHLANGLLCKREAERLRVASELESGIAPLVTVAKLMAEDAQHRIDANEGGSGSAVLLKEASGRLREALGELRRVATALRPSMLDDLGLVPTIEWLCREFEQKQLSIERQIVVVESDIPPSLKLVIFRIIEEALSNVVRHANASTVELVLLRVADELLLWVRDDGTGFEIDRPGNAATLRGIGLASVRKAIEATGGRLTLESVTGEGTRIGATWPLPSRRAVEKRGN